MQSADFLTNLIYGKLKFDSNWDITFDDENENIAYVTNETTGEDFTIKVSKNI